MRHLVAGLFVIAVYTGAGCTATGADAVAPEGTWIIADRVALQTFDCDGLLCGKVVWLRNPALRTAAMCGRTIVWGLKMTEPAQWSGGWFFDPEDGTTYNVSARMEGADQIDRQDLQGHRMVRQDRDPDTNPQRRSAGVVLSVVINMAAPTTSIQHVSSDRLRASGQGPGLPGQGE